MKILFLHIPKTGGTALAQYFSHIYKDKIFGTSHTEELKNDFKIYKENILSDYEYVQGHNPFSEVMGHANKFDYIISVIREPFSRLISHCNYIGADDFSKFLRENYLDNICTRNEQCGYVGFHNTFDSVLEALKSHPNLILFRYDRLAYGFAKFCESNNLGNGILENVNTSNSKKISHRNICIKRKDIEESCNWFSDDFLLYSYLLSSGKEYISGQDLIHL